MSDPVTGLSPEARADLRARFGLLARLNNMANNEGAFHRALFAESRDAIELLLDMLDAAERDRDEADYVCRATGEKLAMVREMRDQATAQCGSLQRTLAEIDKHAWIASDALANGGTPAVALQQLARIRLYAQASPVTESRPHRHDQCDDTCTVDCGHCKGNGPLASRNEPSRNEGDRDAPLA